MTILHLGHQPVDVGLDGDSLSTNSNGFDSRFDVNALYTGPAQSTGSNLAFSLPLSQASSDLWLAFRLRTTTNTTASTNATSSDVMLNFTQGGNPVARVVRVAISGAADGWNFRTDVWNGSSWVNGATAETPRTGEKWIDIHLEIDTDITLSFYIGGSLVSQATATNGAGRSECDAVACFFQQRLANPPGGSTWNTYVAHIAALDGVSTINRRFCRYVPDAVGYANQWQGSINALSDGSLLTAVAAQAVGERVAFTVDGPALPAHDAVLGVHLAVIGEAVDGLTRMRPFVRTDGSNHDGPQALQFEENAIRRRYVSLPENLHTEAPWTAATLPDEFGLLSEA